MAEMTDKIVGFLNDIIKVDKDAIEALISSRVPCNSLMAEHPFVQVLPDSSNPTINWTPSCKVGLMGILNGITLTYDNEYIFADFDKDNHLTGFRSQPVDKGQKA